jgi:hypothetical protein
MITAASGVQITAGCQEGARSVTSPPIAPPATMPTTPPPQIPLVHWPRVPGLPYRGLRKLPYRVAMVLAHGRYQYGPRVAG